MRRFVWRAGSAAIAIPLFMLPAGAVDTSRMMRLAQNASDAVRGPPEPSPPPVADTAAALPANSPEQIRKAQIELRRLDCLTGRADGKLGDQTRQAVKKFWTSAKQPAVEINITDRLIAELVERGDGFCRPPRRFFAIGGRPGGNSALPPPLAPGIRPPPGLGMPARTPAAAPQ